MVPPEQGDGSQQLFQRMLPGSLLPPFLRREPGDDAGGGEGHNVDRCINYKLSKHMLSVPRPSPFFDALLLPCIMLNANRRPKMGEARERG